MTAATGRPSSFPALVPAPAAAPAQEITRVGLVTPAWPPGSLSNGIVTYVANMRLGLASLGVGSAVLASRVAGPIIPEEQDDVVDAAGQRPSLRHRVIWKVQQRLTGTSTADQRLGHAAGAAARTAHSRQPLDLFEMEESFGSARFAQRAIPRPLVVRLHGPWCLVSPALGRPDDAAAFQRRVEAEGRAIILADGVSSPSRHALERARSHYNVSLPHAAVVPNPMDTQPPALRWKYEDCDKRTVLFVGRFDRLKGGDVVLAAFARLATEIPQARLVFVGPDSGLRDQQGKTWNFRDYAAAHLPAELLGRIDMLGEQPPARIAELRRSSFVTLLASRFETFSMTAVEALSHGSPLVAPRAAAIVEIVEDDRNGLLFADADDADAGRQLTRLFRDPELARRLGAAGSEDSARRFAPEVVARQMLAFYGDVRARWGGKARQ
ncbi:MAG: glycosyltransferase family 4 protein [Myxococcales bacterium]